MTNSSMSQWEARETSLGGWRLLASRVMQTNETSMHHQAAPPPQKKKKPFTFLLMSSPVVKLQYMVGFVLYESLILMIGLD